MEALTTSHSTLGGDLLGCSRHQVRFAGHHKRVSNVRFLQCSLSQRAMAVHSVPSSSLSEKSQDNSESSVQDSYQASTVHVKFKLQKECLFGEHFFIVGDVPSLGSWDPSCAIPLDWSNEHIWTVEMDVPTEKSIQFKFILKDRTGNIFWQPGPDRTFQPWETANIITISEDWENPGSQNLVEEEPKPSPDEESIPSPDEESIPSPDVIEQNKNCTLLLEHPLTNLSNGTTDAKNSISSMESMAVQDDVEIENNIPKADNGNIVALGDPITTSVEKNQNVYEGGPALVPGLTSLSSESENEQTKVRHDEVSTVRWTRSIPIVDAVEASGTLSSIASTGNGAWHKAEGNTHSNSSTKGEGSPMSSNTEVKHDKEPKNLAAVSEVQEQIDSEPSAQNVLNNDMKWGRRTLQKFLSNLGLI